MHAEWIAGAVQSLLCLVATFGQWQQLRKVRARALRSHHMPTAGLIPAYFFVSFMATWSIMLVGITRTEFNHWIFWVRIPVVLILLALLNYLSRDGKRRRQRYYVRAALGLSILLGLLALVYPLFGSAIRELSFSADWIIVIVAWLLMFFKLQQAWQIVKSDRLHAVSPWREFTILLKDGGALLYALILGDDGMSLGVYATLSMFSLVILNAVTFRAYWKHRGKE